MEYKEAKKELKSYRYYEIRSQSQLDELLRLDSQCKRVTSVITGMPSAYNPNRKEEIWVKYIDEMNKLIEYLSKDTEIKKNIRRKLEKLKEIDQEAETILEERFIKKKEVPTIARELGYSLRTMNRRVNSSIMKYSTIE